jgi:hypothetical protein
LNPLPLWKPRPACASQRKREALDCRIEFSRVTEFGVRGSWGSCKGGNSCRERASALEDFSATPRSLACFVLGRGVQKGYLLVFAFAGSCRPGITKV